MGRGNKVVASRFYHARPKCGFNIRGRTLCWSRDIPSWRKIMLRHLKTPVALAAALLLSTATAPDPRR